MRGLFADLYSKLDALSNYHFAPRPVAEEATVCLVANAAPSGWLNEVLPLHVSNARGTAPEEIYGSKMGRDGILRGESDMDKVSFSIFSFFSYSFQSIFLFFVDYLSVIF